MANPYETEFAPSVSPVSGANPYDADFGGGPAPSTSGDTSRGFQVAMGQTVPLAKGAVGLVGATAEKAFGEGGISTAIKNWGLRGYQQGMQALEPLQRDTDELTTAWERAKQGDLGALVDWAQYGIGYSAGQVAQAAVTAGAGALVGGAVGSAAAPGPGTAAGAVAGGVGGALEGVAVRTAAKGFIEKLVANEAAKIAATAEGANLAKDIVVRQATANVAKTIGAATAVTGYTGVQEAGSIYPDAEKQATETGVPLDGADLARVWAATAGATALESATELLGLGAVTGRVKIPGTGGRVAKAAIGGTIGAVGEAATEGAQTFLERVGSGQSLNDEAAWKDYINSAGLGAIGGHAMGTIAGALHPSERRAIAETKLAEATNIDEIAAAATDLAGSVAEFQQAHNDFVAETLQSPTSVVETQQPVAPTQQYDESVLGPVNTATAQRMAARIPGAQAQMPALLDSVRQRAAEERVNAPLEPRTGQVTENPDASRRIGAAALEAPYSADFAPLPATPAEAEISRRARGTSAADRAFTADVQAGRITPEDVARTLPAQEPKSGEPLRPGSPIVRASERRGVAPEIAASLDAVEAERTDGAQIDVVHPDELPSAKDATLVGPENDIPLTREVHGALSAVAQALGQKLVVVKADKLIADAWVDPAQPGTVFLNARATKPHLALFGHEFGHNLQKFAPQAYDALVKVVQNEIGPDGLAKHAADYGAHTTIDEVTSDLVGNRLLEPEFMQRVIQEIATTLTPKAATTTITRLGMTLNKVITKIKKTLLRQDAFAVDAMVKDLDKIRDAVRTAIVAYAKQRAAGTPTLSNAPKQASASPSARDGGVQTVPKPPQRVAIDASPQGAVLDVSPGDQDREALRDEIGRFTARDSTRRDAARREKEFKQSESPAERARREKEFKQSESPAERARREKEFKQSERRTQTETPEFKAWFGKSKLVDKDGTPLVMYHGTTADFNTFKPSEGGILGPGIYLTTDRTEAGVYTSKFRMEGGTTSEGGNVMPVYARIENPVPAPLRTRADLRGMSDVDEIAALVRMGYDGIITTLKSGEKVAVAFMPSQVKSALGNSGAFSRTNPDIRKSERRLPEVKPRFRAALEEGAKGLTDSEVAKLRGDTATKFVKTLSTLPETDEMAAIAWAGRAKRGWYKGSAEAMVTVFGPDAPRFAALLAALSPQTSVELNLQNALNTWKNWTAAGRPQTAAEIRKVMGRSVQGHKGEKSVLGAWRNNVVSALTVEDPADTEFNLSGPKVNSFFQNLIGHANEVTNDTWMANYAMIEQDLFAGSKRLVHGKKIGDKGWGYLAMSAKVRMAAARLTELTGDTWSPAEVQETIWSWAKALYEAQKDGVSASELLYNEELTDELVNATPDFRTLFQGGTYAKILEASGLSAELASLRDERSGAAPVGRREGEKAPFDSSTQSAFENAAAQRLERLKAEGRPDRVYLASERRQPLTLEGVHYSQQPRTYLSSDSAGTGLKGAERERGATKDRINFYVDKGQGVQPEAGVGAYAHKATLANLYDMGADPDHLGHDSKGLNDFEKRVVDAGYAGYYNPDFTTKQGAAVLLGKNNIKVERAGEGALPPSGAVVPRAVRKDTGFRATIAKLEGLKSLPAGALTPARWGQTLKMAAPALHAEMADSGVFSSGTEPVYKNELVQRYKDTQIKASERRATLGDFTSENLPDLLTRKDWTILTAADPAAQKQSDAENAKANAALEKDLADAGYEHTPVIGKYGDVQPGFIVTGITEEKAKALGQKYGQESILTRDGLVYSDGRPNTPVDGTVTVYDKPPEDFYTEVPSTGAYFQVGLKFSERRLLAPNGAPSNLNERQHAQVRTPEFKKWFGDWEKFAAMPSGVWHDAKGEVSKAVDVNGEPLVVYHGTDKAGFAEFTANGRAPGVFTSSNKDVAKSYVRAGRAKDVTLTDLSSPLTASEKAEVLEFAQTRWRLRGLTALRGRGGPTTYEQALEAFGTSVIGEALGAEPNKLSGVYAVFLNLRNPQEEYFEGANFDGSGFSVIDENGEEIPFENGMLYTLLRSEAEALAEQNPGSEVSDGGHFSNTDAVVRDAAKSGNDGVIIHNVVDDGGGASAYNAEPSEVYVVLDGAQIKSADFNTGEFSGSTKDIRFSPRRNIYNAVVAPTWAMPQVSILDDVLYRLQDKHIDLKRVTQAIGAIADRFDPYLGETLYHGRSAKATQDFANNELKPLLVEMKARGIALPDLETYLHNRHAEERNVQIAKVNPNMPDGGSGIKTADARAYLRALTQVQTRGYSALAARVDRINAGTRALLVSSGLETQDTVDAWTKTYSKYVPLQRADMDLGQHGSGTGAGFSTRGSAAKRAMGSEREVVDILANLARQRETTITRAEKNRVSQALYGLAVQRPNSDFWLAVNPEAELDPLSQNKLMSELIHLGMSPMDADGLMKEPVQRFIDPKTGLVTERINPALRGRDNVVAMRVDGKDRFVFLSEQDARAERLAEAFKNLDAKPLGEIMSVLGKASRWISSVNTQYNPIFGLINFIRDVQGAALNLSTTPIAGKQAEVMRQVLPALRGIYIDVRHTRAGTPSTSAWSQLWEEFQREGGQTGYKSVYASSAERAIAIADELKQMSEGKLKQSGRAVLDWLSDYNESIENSTRLAAYKVAKDSGMSPARAAELAKDITVNFNRKGKIATDAGALWAFFNAAVQGTERTVRTLAGPTGKKILYGGLLLGVLQALAIAAAGFDDGEPPDQVKERNFVFPLGDGTYATIPMPQGFNVIPGVSRLATEFALRGFKEPTKMLGGLGTLAASLNPMGGAGTLAQVLTPTALDPVMALAENKDAFGRPIAKQDRSGLKPTPGFTRKKDTATTPSTWLAEAINWVTGGTKYTPGMLSPTPDQIDFLAGQIGGGVVRELGKVEQTVASQITGEALPPYKVPVLGRFYGDTTTPSAVAAKFYLNAARLGEHELELAGRRKDHTGGTAEYIAANPEAVLVPMAKAVEQKVSELRSKKSKALEKGDTERVKMLEEMISIRMKSLNDRVKELAAQ